MEQQSNTQPLKKPVTFVKSILIFVYNSIIVALFTFIPFMISSGIIMIVKFSEEASGGNLEAVQEQLAASPAITTYALLLNILALALVAVAIFQDLVKNYQVDKINYKKIVGYMTVLFLLRALTDFSIISVVLSLFAVGLLYWLLDKKFNKSEAVLEKKILTGRNIVILVISILILTTVVFYIA